MKKKPSRKAKPSKVVKRYYSVVFDDNTETVVSSGVYPIANPIALREFEGRKGEELEIMRYSLVETKGKVYVVNGDTPLTQEKALTKSELVKLYEEFKEKKKAEHDKRVVKYEQGMMQRLKDSLEQWRGMCLGSREMPKWIKGEDFVMEYDKIFDNKPKYTEPTFDEFMESLGEKKDLMDEWENANAEWEKGMVKLMNKQLFGSCQN